MFLVFPYYSEENLKFTKGVHELCKEYPLIFTRTTDEPENVYLKIITSINKINLSDISEEIEIGDGIVTKTINEKDSDILFERIKDVKGKMQTKTIILKFN